MKQKSALPALLQHHEDRQGACALIFLNKIRFSAHAIPAIQKRRDHDEEKRKQVHRMHRYPVRAPLRGAGLLLSGSDLRGHPRVRPGYGPVHRLPFLRKEVLKKPLRPMPERFFLGYRFCGSGSADTAASAFFFSRCRLLCSRNLARRRASFSSSAICSGVSSGWGA